MTVRQALLAVILALLSGVTTPALAQTPAQKTADAAAIFAELCGKSLPGMSGLEKKVLDISARAFANSGGVNQPGVFVQGGSIHNNVGFAAGTPKWRDSDGMYLCQVTVFRINRRETVAAIFSAFEAAKPSSVKLTPIEPAPSGMLAAWQVSGAKSGMRLEARRESQNGVQFRLAWKG